MKQWCPLYVFLYSYRAPERAVFLCSTCMNFLTSKNEYFVQTTSKKPWITTQIIHLFQILAPSAETAVHMVHSSPYHVMIHTYLWSYPFIKSYTNPNALNTSKKITLYTVHIIIPCHFHICIFRNYSSKHTTTIFLPLIHFKLHCIN